MNKEHITIKVWRQTLEKLRFIHAYTGESLVFILDKLVTEKLERIKDDKESS